MSDDSCNQKPDLNFAFTGPTGPYTPPPPKSCGTLDYSTSECAERESQYVANLMAEALNAAAGPVNIFPLLGVHSQGSTIDQIGLGFPLSSGTMGGYNALDGFNVNEASWRSIQTGSAVISSPAYIGYDFGTKKNWNGTQERYYPGEPVRKKISTIKIRQGALAVNRATQLKVEASDDGVHWQRIGIANVPNDGNLNTINVPSHAAFNKWRIVPVFFGGVAANAPWEVVQIQMLEASQVSLDNIQDYVLLENRDRSYLRTSTLIKCQYDLLDVQTELAKFGINLPQTYIFSCSFQTMIQVLGRPVVIGDIVELPGETQYDSQLRPVKKWLEVTDTGWSTEGYTMNWKPQLFRFYAQPILPSIEHKDILGVPGQVNSLQTDNDSILNGLLQNDQAFKASEAIEQAAEDLVPQTGADPQDLMSGMPLLGPKGGYDGKDLYVQDAIPPDGAPYTVGDSLPDIADVTIGDYHRLTYTNVHSSIRPPDKLLRYNGNGRWKVVENNTRGKNVSHKKTMDKFIGSSNKIDPDDKP